MMYGCFFVVAVGVGVMGVFDIFGGDCHSSAVGFAAEEWKCG